MKKLFGLLFVLALSALAFSAQTEKSLNLPAAGIQKLSVDAGAGSLKIDGVEGLSSIEVQAEIIVKGVGDRKLEDFLKDHLRLSLEQSGGEAVLKGYFEFTGITLFSPEATVNLTVRMPKAMSLYVDDGSGWLTVANIKGEVSIDDGSGELSAENIEGDLIIDDGSGEIEVRNITGNVRIDDGSGSMTIERVGGSVRVDDGSGSISIDDVAKDVVFTSTGSGSVHTKNVRGQVIR